ncbi:MAG: tRNA 2-thiocytidine(32) synthetase TtcA, partial [Myxococcales bacterium]|nr:tRNA 2-thiocytidine(32) synthetase TtcA [Myxococcales bacterium]
MNEAAPEKPEKAPQASRRLRRLMGKTIADYDLISAGDHIMVAVSGGKDSYTLLDLLAAARERAPIDFRLTAVHLDQVQPGYDGSTLRAWLEDFSRRTGAGFEYRLVARDTHTPVKAHTPAGKAYCSLCSRLRRGILYTVAERIGATVIALGHHRDDALETLLMNLFYTGRMQAMPAKLRSDDGRNVIVRPLATCAEAEIAEYARLSAFPVVPCDLCGSQPNLKRAEVKALLASLEQHNPLLRKNLMAAIANVKPSHLWDPALGAGAAELDDEAELESGSDSGFVRL